MSKVTIKNDNYIKFRSVEWDFTELNSGTNNIHPYPARFINEIPGNLIDLLCNGNDNVIFDPFCGSGTTLEEAQSRGMVSVGIDLNPIACLISKVKTSSITDDFMKIAKSVIDRSYTDYINADVNIPKIPNLDHWFKKDVQDAISCLLKEINNTKDIRVQNALRLALSSIIVRVSNQESDTRYAAIEKKSIGKDVFRLFELACNKIAREKQHKTYCAESRVLCKNILEIEPEDIGLKVDLVITSPPYPNAYEYWLYHKYRMWWLGYDPIDVRKHEIGARPHYQKKNGHTELDFSNQMGEVFDLLNEVVNPGGHVCVVIGRSIIKGREIDNAELVANVAKRRGYELMVNINRRISSQKKSFNLKYGKIKRENILVFQKENKE